MKKIAALCMCVLMFLSFAGCGNDEYQETSSTGSAQSKTGSISKLDYELTETIEVGPLQFMVPKYLDSTTNFVSKDPYALLHLPNDIDLSINYYTKHDDLFDDTKYEDIWAYVEEEKNEERHQGYEELNRKVVDNDVQTYYATYTTDLLYTKGIFRAYSFTFEYGDSLYNITVYNRIEQPYNTEDLLYDVVGSMTEIVKIPAEPEVPLDIDKLKPVKRMIEHPSSDTRSKLTLTSDEDRDQSLSAEILCADYTLDEDGGPVLAVWFDYRNDSEESRMFLISFNFIVMQGESELVPISMLSLDEEYLSGINDVRTDNGVTSVPEGQQRYVCVTYELKNESDPVGIGLTGSAALFSSGGKTISKYYTFD